MDRDTIKDKINRCIDRIYIEDGDLFHRKNYEVTISSKLAHYLFLEFPEYDVDCEYNKHIDNEKEATINGVIKNIRPDISVHKRGTDDHNLVAIEIKKIQNRTNRNLDYEKLSALTNDGDEYRYSLGVFIDFTQSPDNRIVKFFEHGREVQ